MPVGVSGASRRSLLGWWSPDPRGVLPVDRLRVSRSLGRSIRRFEVRVDTAFAAVVATCADPRRPGGWITHEIRSAYVRLHELGWAHSVEAWNRAGELAGGVYGLAIGGLFAGESMFHHERDASKVALVGLVGIPMADAHPGCLFDVQWVTPHLASLGAVDIRPNDYLERLGRALRAPLPRALAHP